MKKVIMRSLAAVLIVIMLVSVLPLNSAAATKYSASKYTSNTKIQKNLESILNGQYGPGKFYTKNGKACSCHLEDTEKKTAPNCNCLLKPKINGKAVYLGTSQCEGYARYCQRMLFGVDEYNNKKEFKKINNSVKFSSDADKCKKWFVDNQSSLHVGAHIRVYGDGHSIVLLNVDYKKGNVTVLECNYTNQSKNNGKWCQVNKVKSFTWKEFAKRYLSVSYIYVYKDYNSKYGKTYTVDASVSSVTAADAVFNASIENSDIGVEKWACGIGTEEEVKAMKVSGLEPKNNSSTETFDYSTVSVNDGAFSIDKIGENSLQPSTTYYYRVCAKICGVWYQTDVGSFTTEPEETGSEKTEPDEVEPDETEPESTEKEVTEPDTTEQEETEPDETEQEETEPERQTETITGDINGDGERDNKDVVVLFRYVSSSVTADDETVYDYNVDGEVNNKDVVELFRTLSANE